MFVLLEHDAPDGVHWDFMLEVAGQELLRAWRLSRNPIHGAEPIEAAAIGDHRRAYLDYEGPISGGRGRVRRIDRGACEVIAERDSEVQVVLNGEALHGTYVMRRVGEELTFSRILTADNETDRKQSDER